MIDKQELNDRLVNELDCKKSQVESVMKKIETLSPDVYSAFKVWFDTGELTDMSIEGYTVHRLLENDKNLNPVGAFLTLDWLKREPIKAKLAINQKEFLNSAISRGR